MAVDVAPGGSLCTCSETGETDDVRPMTGQASGFCLRLRRPASGLRTTMSFYLSSACSKICMCTHSDYYSVFTPGWVFGFFFPVHTRGLPCKGEATLYIWPYQEKTLESVVPQRTSHGRVRQELPRKARRES